MLKKVIILLLIIGISVFLIGFISKSIAKDNPKVVVVLKDLDSQYWEIVKAGAEKGFNDFNLDGKVIGTRNSTDIKQLYMLEKILEEKPDALVVSPFETSGVQSILNEFTENNIPVLLLDTDIPLKKKTSYIGTDNFHLGWKAGAMLGSELKPGDKVALIAGDIKSPILGERIKGAKTSLEAAGIKIAAEKEKLQNESLSVKTAMSDILQDHPDIKGVFAVTDIMALYAFEAIEEQGYHIPVIGVDGIIDMVELVEEGTLSGTVAQNPYDMGYLGVKNALKVIKGEKVDRNIDSGVDIIIKGNGKQRLEFLKKILE